MPEHDCHHSENETSRNALLQQVAVLESEMDETRAQIAQKQAFLLEQKQECRQLNSQLNSLSPIDQLPAEIKTEIFYNALCPLTKEGKSPFFLGKISRGWRDFVWSSPVLWTNMYLRLTKKGCKVQTNLLRAWLPRTAGCPLTFCLASDWEGTYDGSSVKEIFSMLASVSTQWKDVEFSLPDSKVCFDAISKAEKSLPLLTAATVHFSSNQRQFNLFSVAPQLSTLCLNKILLARVLAPWHQLKEFTAYDIPLHEVREFLQKAPNIIRCTFDDDGSRIRDEPQDTFVKPLVLEHLEYLQLWVASKGVGVTQILGSVELPSLREVYLHGHFGSSSRAILPAIMISFCSSHLLGKFTLRGAITSDDELIRVLGYIPSTKDLCLELGGYQQDEYGPILTERLLRRLCPSHADILLPNLRSFTYYGPSTLNEHMDLFRDVLVYRFRECALRPAEVDSKRGNVSQIQSVTVLTSSRLVISPDIQEDLDCLVKEGLGLSLTSTLE
jgi:hypothetical protein